VAEWKSTSASVSVAPLSIAMFRPPARGKCPSDSTFADTRADDVDVAGLGRQFAEPTPSSVKFPLLTIHRPGCGR